MIKHYGIRKTNIISYFYGEIVNGTDDDHADVESVIVNDFDVVHADYVLGSHYDSSAYDSMSPEIGNAIFVSAAQEIYSDAYVVRVTVPVAAAAAE